MNNAKDIVALVLAGGEGKRFWPITSSKSQLNFLGKSLLVHNLERLSLTGIKNVIVVIHPQDKEALAKLIIKDLSIQTIVQPEPNGMAGAVIAAQELIKGKAVFIMNAEDLVSEKLFKELAGVIGGESLTVVGLEVTKYFPGGYLMMENEKLTGIVEKPGAGNEPSNLVDLVFDYFPSADELLDKLNSLKTDKDDLFEVALNELLKAGTAKVIKYSDYWFPTKYPWQILNVMEQLLKEVKDYRGQNVVIKQNVVIEGAVYIEDNVRIFENTKIVGPCYIGAGTIIGNNNIIRHSHIGGGCVTGFNTDITRSYVGDNSWFHSNYIGDSVLEGNTSLGSGSVLANLRLDEGEISSIVKDEKIQTNRNKLGVIIGTNVRIGVNASIMPGVKIGTGSFVGAGVVLGQDLPDASFCLAKNEYVITLNKQNILSKSRDEFKNNL